MNKPVPNAVAQFLVIERRQNTDLRTKIDRLLDAARLVTQGAEHIDRDSVVCSAEDMDELVAAVNEWGKA